MTFLESLKYELWEFGWDGLRGSLKLLLPFLLCCFGWKYWKNSYSERRNRYGLRLEKQVKAELKTIEPRIYVWSNYAGTQLINIGYDLTYNYDFYGKHYEDKDYIPRNSEFPVNQMIKQLQDTTYTSYIQVRIDKNNPNESQIVIQPLVYY